MEEMCTSDVPIILVEPRKAVIDHIRNSLPKHVSLVPKMLSSTNTMCETSLYQVDDCYFTEYPMYKGSSKQRTYCTSLSNIIKEHKIQNVEKLVFNLNVDNCKEVFENIGCFNHILSRVKFSSFISFEYSRSKLLQTCFNEVSDVFEHKNLNVPLPKILMYLIEDVPESLKPKFDLLVSQYNISVISLQPKGRKELFHDYVVRALGTLGTLDTECDIILQFNPRYLIQNECFQLFYPLKDDTLYVNRSYDIMYATKNSMVMLLQIVKSKYFTDYMKDMETQKRAIYKLFCKSYFYEYISKIFTTNDIS
jgi:hypothetical protein